MHKYGFVIKKKHNIKNVAVLYLNKQLQMKSFVLLVQQIKKLKTSDTSNNNNMEKKLTFPRNFIHNIFSYIDCFSTNVGGNKPNIYKQLITK